MGPAMWRETEAQSPTLWFNIVAHSERVYSFSVTRSTGGIIVPNDKVQISLPMHQNLSQALGQLTDPCRASRPEAFAQLGHLLFRLVLPERLQDLLRQPQFAGPIVFATEELSLPWELLHDGQQFLCLQRPFSRQPNGDQLADLLFGSPQTPRSEAAAGRVLVVADPNGTLPSAVEEAEEVRALFAASGLECDTLIGPRECTYLEIMARMSRVPYDIIHFSGHAQALTAHDTPTSGFLLADNQLLMAEDIRRGLVGEPVVFLNACHTTPVEATTTAGDAAPSALAPRTVRTLAQAFTIGNRAGRARAVLGSMWWIDDVVARGIAGRFYQAVLDGHPLGEALRRARADVAAGNGDPALWSSYVLFGDPLLVLERQPAPAAAADDASVGKTTTDPRLSEDPAQPRGGGGEPSPPVDSPARPDAANVAGLSALAEGLPWSDEVRLALSGALAAMSMMHWSLFSTVHLLIGLTYLERGALSRALQQKGIDPAGARRFLRQTLIRTETADKPAEFVIGANLKNVLTRAKALAREDGDGEVAERHILRALLEFPQSGAVLLLAAMHVDADAIRAALQPAAPASTTLASAPASTASASHAPQPPRQFEILLPDGRLNRSAFAPEMWSALEVAAEVAFRTNWLDLRSPHLFLGVLLREHSRLADHLRAGQMLDPTSFGGALLRGLTAPRAETPFKPRLHREFLSENALQALRAARQHALDRQASLISERDLVASMLANDNNIITQSLRQIGLAPESFLWSEP